MENSKPANKPLSVKAIEGVKLGIPIEADSGEYIDVGGYWLEIMIVKVLIYILPESFASIL